VANKNVPQCKVQFLGNNLMFLFQNFLSSFTVVSLSIIYSVGQKTAPFYFCNNFVKSFCIRIIIGTHVP